MACPSQPVALPVAVKRSTMRIVITVTLAHWAELAHFNKKQKNNRWGLVGNLKALSLTGIPLPDL
jgi:hypothetical protein